MQRRLLDNDNLKFIDLNLFEAYVAYKKRTFSRLSQLLALIEQRGPTCGYYALARVMAHWNAIDSENPHLPARKCDNRDAPETLRSLTKNMDDKIIARITGALFKSQYLIDIAEQVGYAGQIHNVTSFNNFCRFIQEAINNNFPIIIPMDHGVNSVPTLNKGSAAHYVQLFGYVSYQGILEGVVYLSSNYYVYSSIRDLYLSCNNLENWPAMTMTKAGKNWNETPQATGTSQTAQIPQDCETPKKTKKIYNLPEVDLSDMRNKLVAIYPKNYQVRYSQFADQLEETVEAVPAPHEKKNTFSSQFESFKLLMEANANIIRANSFTQKTQALRERARAYQRLLCPREALNDLLDIPTHRLSKKNEAVSQLQELSHPDSIDIAKKCFLIAKDTILFEIDLFNSSGEETQGESKEQIQSLYHEAFSDYIKQLLDLGSIKAVLNSPLSHLLIQAIIDANLGKRNVQFPMGEIEDLLKDILNELKDVREVYVKKWFRGLSLIEWTSICKLLEKDFLSDLLNLNSKHVTACFKTYHDLALCLDSLPHASTIILKILGGAVLQALCPSSEQIISFLSSRKQLIDRINFMLLIETNFFREQVQTIDNLKKIINLFQNPQAITVLKKYGMSELKNLIKTPDDFINLFRRDIFSEMLIDRFIELPETEWIEEVFSHIDDALLVFNAFDRWESDNFLQKFCSLNKCESLVHCRQSYEANILIRYKALDSTEIETIENYFNHNVKKIKKFLEGYFQFYESYNGSMPEDINDATHPLQLFFQKYPNKKLEPQRLFSTLSSPMRSDEDVLRNCDCTRPY